MWTGLRLGRRCRLTARHWARTFLAGHDYAGWSSTTWIGRTACRRSTVTHSCAQESQQRRTVPGCAPARRTVGAPHDSQCVRGRGAMRTRPTGLGAGNASTFIAPTLINSVTTTQSQSGDPSRQLHDISSSISADRRAMSAGNTRRSTGFVMWLSKPASLARCRSPSRPKRVMASWRPLKLYALEGNLKTQSRRTR